MTKENIKVGAYRQLCSTQVLDWWNIIICHIVRQKINSPHDVTDVMQKVLKKTTPIKIIKSPDFIKIEKGIGCFYSTNISLKLFN